MIDMHCHLDLYQDPQKIIKKCIESEVYVLSVTNTPSAFRHTKYLGDKGSRIQTALGLHPQLAHMRFNELSLFDELVIYTKYVGEIGLDFSREFKAYASIQKKVFKHILNKCSECGGKGLSIHSKGASKEVLSILEQYSKNNTNILHWFTGSISDLNKAIELDCWFSINIKMLQSKKGKELIKSIPLNRILLESDAPFVIESGEVFSPCDTEKIIELIAKLTDMNVVILHDIIYSNFKELLQKVNSYV